MHYFPGTSWRHGAGKTSLALRFVKGQYYDCQESTIGAAFFTQVLSLNEATIKFDIWDTAGQERYHSLAPMYYRGAVAAVLVSDITNKHSFERAKKWVQELQIQGNPNLVTVLVANKVDLNEERSVGNEQKDWQRLDLCVWLESNWRVHYTKEEENYLAAKDDT